MIIRASINLSKIDKSAFYVGKNGDKFLNITLLENRDGEDKYGNHFFITQDLGKEARLAGKRGEILGNGKITQSDRPKRASVSQRDEAPDAPPRGYTTKHNPADEDSSIPF